MHILDTVGRSIIGPGDYQIFSIFLIIGINGGFFSFLYLIVNKITYTCTDLAPM